MYDHNQRELPNSFVALFVEPGRERPRATRAEITTRYEFCEDLAQRLVDYARAQHLDLGITEMDVLERVERGLQAASSGVDSPQARWVVRRLAELQGWAWTGD